MSNFAEIFKPLEPQLFQAKSHQNIFIETIKQGLSIYKKYPEIQNLIIKEQEQHGIAKKLVRQEDQIWLHKQANKTLANLPDLAESNVINISTSVFAEGENPLIKLESGRTRMPPIVVYFFLLIRGFLGSIKSEKNYLFIMESKFVESFLHAQGIDKLYGKTTILENLNLLSEETLRYIHKATIIEGKETGCDDYKKLYFDSTRIEANSSWPSEAKTIKGLTSRVFHGFSILRANEIKINFPQGTEDRIKAISKAAQSIALISGKKDSKNEIKKLYKSIIKISKKLQSVFSEAVERAFSKIGDILPSLKHSLESLCEFIRLDLHDIELCRTNARKRIVENQIVPAEDKVLSISDDDAEIIPKGSKELVFGYKPQIGRSEKGFIVSVIVPQGAASDSDQMRAITDSAIKNTSVNPEVLSYDDGYTNKIERENYLKEGIKVVSFSGSKGKKLTSEVWDNDEYLAARNERSMAESTMSVLKGYFGLHRFSRRGIEAVTQELLTASIFHNLRLLAKLA